MKLFCFTWNVDSQSFYSTQNKPTQIAKESSFFSKKEENKKYIDFMNAFNNYFLDLNQSKTEVAIISTNNEVDDHFHQVVVNYMNGINFKRVLFKKIETSKGLYNITSIFTDTEFGQEVVEELKDTGDMYGDEFGKYYSSSKQGVNLYTSDPQETEFFTDSRSIKQLIINGFALGLFLPIKIKDRRLLIINANFSKNTPEKILKETDSYFVDRVCKVFSQVEIIEMLNVLMLQDYDLFDGVFLMGDFNTTSNFNYYGNYIDFDFNRMQYDDNLFGENGIFNKSTKDGYFEEGNGRLHEVTNVKLETIPNVKTTTGTVQINSYVSGTNVFGIGVKGYYNGKRPTYQYKKGSTTEIEKVEKDYLIDNTENKFPSFYPTWFKNNNYLPSSNNSTAIYSALIPSVGCNTRSQTYVQPGYQKLYYLYNSYGWRNRILYKSTKKTISCFYYDRFKSEGSVIIAESRFHPVVGFYLI